MKRIVGEVRITGYTGHGPADRITWHMYAPFQLLPQDAMEAQAKEGYDPTGYGFFNFKTEEENLGLFTATWSCAASAD